MYKLTIEFETAAALAAFVDILNHEENEDAPAVPGAPAAAPKPRGRKPKAGTVDPATIANPPGVAPQNPVFTTAGIPVNPIGSTPALPSAGPAPLAPPMMPSPSVAGIPMAGPAGSSSVFTPPTFAPPMPAPQPPMSAPAPMSQAAVAATPPQFASPAASTPTSTATAASPSNLPQAGPPVQSAALPGMTYEQNILPVLQRIGTEKGRAVVEALAQRYGVTAFPTLPPALFGDFIWYTGMILNAGFDPRAGTQATPGAMY